MDPSVKQVHEQARVLGNNLVGVRDRRIRECSIRSEPRDFFPLQKFSVHLPIVDFIRFDVTRLGMVVANYRIYRF